MPKRRCRLSGTHREASEPGAERRRAYVRAAELNPTAFDILALRQQGWKLPLPPPGSPLR